MSKFLGDSYFTQLQTQRKLHCHNPPPLYEGPPTCPECIFMTLNTEEDEVQNAAKCLNQSLLIFLALNSSGCLQSKSHLNFFPVFHVSLALSQALHSSSLFQPHIPLDSIT